MERKGKKKQDKGATLKGGPADKQDNQAGKPSTDESVDWQDVAKRALADLDNYKKQAEKDKFEMIRIVKGSALVKFLEIYDDLSRAIEFVEDEKTKQGLLAVKDKFLKMMESEGLETVIVEFGEKFDPMVMEAISYEDNELVKDNHVIEMVEAGLKVGDRVIKPAKVRVGK